MICIRPDCGKELHSGKKYCSAKCSAMDRPRVKLEKVVATAPPEIMSRLESLVGSENTALVMAEVNRFLADEKISIPMPMTGQTYGDLVLSYDGTKEYRPGSTLSFDIIDKMLRSGPVVFAMEMKRAQVFRVFSQGRYKVVSPDTELAEIAEASLKLIMPKMMHDVTWSSFAYGTSFSEELWEWKTKYELGMSDTKDKIEFLVPKVPNSVNPCTVDYIRRNTDGSFNGFAQKRKYDVTVSSIDPIEVSREQALVIPMNEHFRNLWGESVLKPMYVLWLWYEIIFRTMVRYMDRMAIPWKVIKAPSRATVTVSGSNAPVRAMDLALAIGANIDKSGVIAIPSDVDESGHPLWDFELVTAESRVQLFMEVLQYLGQEMIRSVLSADRATTQSSGGVGSYNIGEVHAAASAVTSEMILLQFLHYLNMYFMPEFALYNRGEGGPPMWLRTQAIDTAERDLLMQLIGVAGNSPAAQELFYMIDWRTLLETSNIPPLPEEEVQKLKDKIDKQQADKMETQQKIMAKNAAPIAKGGASAFASKDAAKPATPEPTAVKTEAELDNIALENIFKYQVPWMLGEHEARVLYDNGLVSDEVIRLFNPFHSRSDGKFTSGQGFGGVGLDPSRPSVVSIGGAQRAGEIDVRGQAIAKARGGGIVKTTGKILGLAGLGLVGLAVIGGVASASSPDPMDQYQQNKDAKAEELQQRLDELTKDWPKTNSPEEAVSVLQERLQALGLDGIPPDLGVTIVGTSDSIGGFYDPNSNVLAISETIAGSLQDGNPIPVWAMMHEIAHSNQEIGDGQNNYGDFSTIEGGVNSPEYRSFMEGQNDLVTGLGMSALYHKPMDNTEAISLGNEAEDLKRKVSSIKSGVTITSGYTQTTEIGYEEDAKVWAAIATVSAEKSGTTPKNYLLQQHANGDDGVQQHNILVNLFPDEMKSGGFYKDTGERKFPSMSEVRTWMSNHGYVDPDKAYKQMLEDAAHG